MRQGLLRRLSDQECEHLANLWAFWARDSQLEPEGSWRIWAVITGRGFGKTRMGSEWAHDKAASRPGSHGFIAARTIFDARETLLFHQTSGIMTTAREDNPCRFIESRRLVIWKNGSFAHLYTSEEPDGARGPEHNWGIADEFATWKRVKDQRGNTLWDNLQFGLRAAPLPRMIATTTPRPIPSVKSLVAQALRADSDVVLTRGHMYENRDNLAPEFISAIEERYGHSLLARQEMAGEIVEEIEGALIQRAWIEESRVEEPPSDIDRIVVAIDPALGAKSTNDETGIVAAGVRGSGREAHAYLLADQSCRDHPNGWGSRAVALFYSLEADRIVAEANQGGEMVSHVINTIDPTVPVTLVHAKRGKHVRAEPIASLYARHRIHHVGHYPELEDQLSLFDHRGYQGEGSPDRADAAVWALTDLVIRPRRASWEDLYGAARQTPLESAHE